MAETGEKFTTKLKKFLKALIKKMEECCG